MKLLDHISTVYFVGIGGIGMSALARFTQQKGLQVVGYDKTPSRITDELMGEGMPITFKDEVSELDLQQLGPDKTLVVYTPAVPSNNNILSYFRTAGYKVMKRAQLLGEITQDTMCLAVAGTHGKTTTSAILGHLLLENQMPVTAFLGGIAENYDSNFISNGTEITVVEADEFDRSFLHLRPSVACITSIDADHLDIYGDSSNLVDSFKAFAQLIPSSQKLFVANGIPISGQTVGISDEADFEAKNIRIEDGVYVFDLKTPSELITDLRFLMPGHHNLLNAVTALGMAISAGTPTPGLPKALQSFKGVKRRFSYKLKTDQDVIIDDYAHHPTEIDALNQAVEELYPHDKKLIVFQPHLFSRTQDFADGFANSLSRFDEVLLLDIYPAREEPIEGVTSTWLCDKISSGKKKVITKNELSEAVLNSSCRVKLLVGAGDIGAEVDSVTKNVKNAR